MDHSQVEDGLISRPRINVASKAHHALNMVPVVRGVILCHVGFDIGCSGLD